MKDRSLFDIIGPIMIGPSSSHTAGALKIGKIARRFVNKKIVKAEFLLHGSFLETYRGHGTDKALIAGVLGFETYDERIRDSEIEAKKAGIEIVFGGADLGRVHPNTVKIILTFEDNEQFFLIGSSIGGGQIEIVDINGFEVSFSGEYPSIFIKHKDKVGIISKVTTILGMYFQMNIANMHISRKLKGESAFSIIEVDENITEELLIKLKMIEEIEQIRHFNPQGGI